jgi:hypothetical protein
MPRVAQPATCPACDVEFLPRDRLAKVSTQIYCSLPCRHRYRVRRGRDKCNRCGGPRTGGSGTTYCRPCQREFERANCLAGRLACRVCGEPRESDAPHPSYCKACYHAKQASYRATAKKRETCARCGKPRGDSSHPTYCRECKTELGRSSYAKRKAAGRLETREFCSRCGKPRDGRHPAYCRDCWRGPIREARFAEPCATCGQTREPDDRISPSYCNRCYRDRWLQRQFGVTLAEWEAKLAEQGGVCAICRRDNGGKQWHTDHDHETGQFRGVLCALCNRGLGHFGDDLARVRRAADYLEGLLVI